MQPIPKVKTSEIIENILNDKVETFGDLMQELGERAFGIAILVFGLIAISPLSGIPGLSILICLPILYFSFQMLIGLRVFWLPKKIKNRSVNKAKLMKALNVTLPWVKRMEKILKPRWMWVTTKIGEVVLGLLFILLAVHLILPIPFTNSVFGLLIASLALGWIERDGILIVIIFIGSVVYMLMISALFFALLNRLFG